MAAGSSRLKIGLKLIKYISTIAGKKNQQAKKFASIVLRSIFEGAFCSARVVVFDRLDVNTITTV